MKKNNNIKIVSFLLIISQLLLSIISVNAYTDTYWDLDLDIRIDYPYSNSKIDKEFDNLVAQTENLKTNYSSTEVKEIVVNVKKLINTMTKEDYDINYEDYLNHYDDLGSYEYMFSEPDWILRNILNLVIMNEKGNAQTELVKYLIDEYYEMAITEMKNGSKLYELMRLMTSINDIEDKVSPSLKDYITYVMRSARIDGANYDEGVIPKKDKISKEYDKYVEEKNKKNEEDVSNYNPPSKDTFVDRDEPNKEGISEEFYDKNNGVEVEVDNSKLIENPNNTFLDTLNTIESGSVKTETNYSIQSLYYSLDKTEKKPTWVETGITLSKDETINFLDLINALNTITKNTTDSYVIEDSDAILFIAEGKPLVINKIDNIKIDDINSLLDSFDKIGFKVMLKSEDNINTDNSLTVKVEAGEINEIFINDSKLILTNKPIVTKNILQLPISQIAEELGYEVKEKDDTITLTLVSNSVNEESDTEDTIEDIDELTKPDDITMNEIEIIFKVGSKNFTINGQKHSLKTEVVKKNDVIYAELNTIAEKANYKYQYNATTGIIELIKNQ